MELRNNHVWYKGYLIPESHKKRLEKMKEKVPFGELINGDEFYYNCFRWRKNTTMRTRIFLTDLRCNAENVDEYGHKVHFADDVLVKPIKRQKS